MGVRGLTTFIASRSKQYHQSYELHDCHVVIDGNSIACQLYNWHSKCNDCFGGDYDKYANVVKHFYKLLEECHITPLVVFDGAYEKRKLRTVYTRMRNRVCSANKLNSVTEDSVPVFPLFLRDLFVDITLQMKLKCMRCNFEGDNEAATLARNLNCPLLSYDSDFYIFDVIYIPFSTMDLRVRKKNNVKYISCQVYNVDKFLNSFGGLDKINLPLLAALLGNDYVHKRPFLHFFKLLKKEKCSGFYNKQQQTIKSVITFLKNETPESALRKILGRYKLQYRKRLARLIQIGIKGYESTDSDICSYFNVDANNQQVNHITVPNPEEIEDLSENEISEDEDETGDNEDEGSSESGSDDNAVDQKPVNKFNLPPFFQENYQKCLYPSGFMDMVVSRKYYCTPQVEDYSLQHSHNISLNILAAIYKILTSPKPRKLIYVARYNKLDIKKFILQPYNKDLPELSAIESMDLNTRKKIFLDVLNIKNDKIFSSFPSTWHLFLISLKYWVTNSTMKVNMPFIYSLILCGIILNYVDNKVGFYRSTTSFLTKYGSNIVNGKGPSNCTETIEESLEEIDVTNSVSCMHKMINYFQMDAKMKSIIRLFDVNIVHQFAEFQTVLLHAKYLNSLLNFPFPSFIISDFYDGTFLYNMTTNLLKRTDLKAYMKILLENSPRVLNTFELMMEQLEPEISSDLVEKAPLRRRRKKKSKKCDADDDDVTMVIESDEEAVLDPNNKYSVLSLVNK